MVVGPCLTGVSEMSIVERSGRGEVKGEVGVNRERLDWLKVVLEYSVEQTVETKPQIEGYNRRRRCQLA